MRYITIFITIIILLGCQSEEELQKEREAKAYKQEQIIKIKEMKREEELQRLKDKEEQERLEKEKNASTVYQMGLSMNDGKIIFDTNKAKSFFSSIVSQVEQVSKDIEENNSTFTKNMGIDINEKENNLTIDFNKTRAFFKHWSSKIELFAKDISSFGEKIDDNNLSK
jgi:hypothetical protein